MGIIALVTLVSAGAGVYMLSKALPNYQPGNKKIQADLKILKQEVEALNTELVPVDQEELELFSHDQLNFSQKKSVTSKIRGVYTTIYHEPILAYGMKRYVSGKRNSIIYAKTAKHEFFFREKKGEVKVVIDNGLVGTLRDNGVLYGSKSKRMIARINRNEQQDLPVIVQDREVATITNLSAILPNKGQSLGKRAFEFVKNDISKEETLLLLALALYEFILKLDPK